MGKYHEYYTIPSKRNEDHMAKAIIIMANIGFHLNTSGKEKPQMKIVLASDRFVECFLKS